MRIPIVPWCSSSARTAGVAAVLVMALLSVGCKDSPPPAPPPGFGDIVRQQSVTVYPALVWAGAPAYDAAAARSLAPFVDDRAGEVRVSDEEILPYTGTMANRRDRAVVAADSIAKHVRSHPLRTDLGLWPVYIWAPGTDQVREVHALLFDGRGRVVRRFKIDRFDPQTRTSEDCTELVKQVVLTRERIYAPKPPEKKD